MKRLVERERGLLIALEGPDGSGKTTQRRLLKDWLVGRNESVTVTKWNSSPLFKPIIKAKKADKSLSPEEFAILHAQDFRYRYENEILPALLDGSIVLADRYAFTGVARDAARGLDRVWSMQLYEPLIWADLVFYFSAPAELCAARIASTRSPKFYEAGQDVTGIADPFESYNVFVRRVMSEYERLGEAFPFITVDASQGIYEQHRFIRSICEEWMRIARVIELSEAILPVTA